MALKKIVAENLRSLCDTFDGSIAQLSRQIGITPQQFNNYLSAKHLPNERVIAKICSLLDVQEDELYVSERIRSRSQTLSKSTIAPNVTEALERWKPEELPNLNPGIYSVYFVTTQQPNAIVRAAMTVERTRDFLTFRRFTSLSRSARIGSGGRRSDHRGIVIQQQTGTLYFMAINERPNYEPSLITAQWASSNTPLLSGYAVVDAARDFEVTAVAIAPEIDLSLKQLMRLMRYYTWDERMIPKSIKNELEHLLSMLSSRRR